MNSARTSSRNADGARGSPSSRTSARTGTARPPGVRPPRRTATARDRARPRAAACRPAAAISPRSIVVGQERLRLRPARERAVLQPADEDRAEAPRPDVRAGPRAGRRRAARRDPSGRRRRRHGAVDGLGRRAERRAGDRRRLAHLDGAERLGVSPAAWPTSAASSAASPASSATAARRSAATRASARSSAASTCARRLCGAVQIASASAASASSSGSAPAAAASASASSASSGGPPRRDSQTARGARVAQLAAPHAQLERVRQRRLQLSRRTQPCEEVVRAPAGQRRPRAREHAGAEPRALQRHPPVVLTGMP